MTAARLRIGYADPPYPGMSRLYRDHPDYAGEVDHTDLIERLVDEYDGWCLHTASTTLAQVIAPLELVSAIRAARGQGPVDYRVMAWVKPFASFKKNVAVAYAWEPVIVSPARKREFDGWTTVRDWIAEPITLKRGLTGAKPERVCHWLFEVMGCHPDDELDDMFPGSGAVSRAWESWRSQLSLTGAA